MWLGIEDIQETIKGNVFTLALLLVALALFFIVRANRKSKTQYQTIPYKGYFFLFKHGRKFLGAVIEFAQKEKAKFVEVNIYGTRLVLATHPLTAQNLMAEDVVGLDKSNLTVPIVSLGTHSLPRVNGEIWRKQRTMFSPVFHYDALVKLSPIFHTKAENLLNTWEKFGDEFQIDAKNWLSKFTLDVLGSAVLGMEFNTISGGNNSYEQAYRYVFSWNSLSWLLNIIPGIWNLKFLFPTLFRSLEIMQQMTREVMNQKIQERNSGQIDDARQVDLLDVMLDKAGSLSVDEILSNVWMFFAAGHETLSTGLGYTMYYLAKYPEYQRIAREEVDSILNKETPNHENIKGLVFVDLFLKEVMRIRTPAAFIQGRRTTKDVIVEDYLIPKDTLVGVMLHAIHHLDEFWPEPEKFDPYRFTAENSKHRPLSAYIPFSLGRRHCIGNNFAQMEQKIFVASFLQKYTVHYVSEPVKLNSINNSIKSLSVLLRARK